MLDATGKRDRRELTSHVALRRVEGVVNPRSGGVGPGAFSACEQLFADYDLQVHLVEAGPTDLDAALSAAVAARPDLLVILAGDGTAGRAATLAGPEGPLIAPLPGGTMNMLPRALYGASDWRVALRRALEHGRPVPVAGGEVDGHAFYVAAILGAPALWGPAREAVRAGKLRRAWIYARQALRRAFGGQLRYRLDGGEPRRAEALALLTPLISKAMTDQTALEAAVMTHHNAAEVFSLAARALIADWRTDPAIETARLQTAEVWARGHVPAILDGESMRLGHEIEIRFNPIAFRALAPDLTSSPDAGVAP
jgi:diacylglycerol kinase family enzyme